MSGELRLTVTPWSAIQAIALDGRLLIERHGEIVAGLSARAPGAAGLFARPQIEADGIAWYANTAGARALSALDAQARAPFEQTLRRVLAVLDDHVFDAEIGDLLNRALIVPGSDAVYAVDGGVVLTGWGLAPAGMPADGDHLANHFLNTLGPFANFVIALDAVAFGAPPGAGDELVSEMALPGAGAGADRDAPTGFSGAAAPALADQPTGFAAEPAATGGFEVEGDGAMDLAAAQAVLGIGDGADAAAIEAAYSNKRRQLEERIAKAPKEALKAKYRAALEEVELAYEMLSDDDAAAITALSATQMMDLPGAAPLASMGDFSGAGSAATGGLAIGDVLLERYEIRRRLGAGGMGVVYAAFDRNREREIALKVLHQRLLQNPMAQQRFMSEAKVSTELSHPNIVNVYDVQKQQAMTFLTMQILEGRNLRQEMEDRRRAKRPFTLTEARLLAAEIGQALSYAHKTTVHRDIKPENLWYGRNGDAIKLMDFGIARLAGPENLNTGAGAAIGTAFYMAPEQLKSARDVDHRADQYSFAIVLYEMLTGHLPQGRVRAVREVRPDVPAKVSKAIDRALDPNPEMRFADIGQFVAAFNTGKAGKAAKARAVAPVMVGGGGTGSGWGRRLAIAAGLAIVLVGAGAGAAIMAGGGPAADGGLFQGFQVPTWARELLRDDQLMRQAEDARRQAVDAQSGWNKLVEVIGERPNADAGDALRALEQGDWEFAEMRDAEAIEDFKQAADRYARAVADTQDAAKAEAMRLAGALRGKKRLLQQEREDLERAERDARSRQRDADNAARSARGGIAQRKAEAQIRAAEIAVNKVETLRDFFRRNIMNDPRVAELDGHMVAGDGLIRDGDFVRARIGLQQAYDDANEVTRLFAAAKPVIDARFAAEAHRAAWQEISQGSMLGMAKNVGRANGLMKRAQTLSQQSRHGESVKAYRAAAKGYKDLVQSAGGVLEQQERQRVAAERARKEAAEQARLADVQRKEQEAAEARRKDEEYRRQQTEQRDREQRMEQQRRASMERERLEMQRQQMAQQRELQERQMRQQRAAQQSQMMMQMLGTFGGMMLSR